MDVIGLLSLMNSGYEMINSFVPKFDRVYNRALKRWTCNNHLRERPDVANDVFTSLWQHLDEYQDNILPSVMAMARNRCINILKREKYKREHNKYVARSRKFDINFTSLADSSIEELFEKDAMKVLMETLEKMPPKTKEAFMLNRFRNKTYSEIAQIQNVSEKNIEYRISSALKILRKAMGLLTFWTINYWL